MTALPTAPPTRDRADRAARRVADRRRRRHHPREQPGELRADGQPRPGLPVRARAPRRLDVRRRARADGAAVRSLARPDERVGGRHDRPGLSRSTGSRRWPSSFARRRSDKARVLVATGHPTGLLVVHIELARALRAAGCTLLTPPARWDDVDARGARTSGTCGRSSGFRVASQGANLLHTHSPRPMELMLQALRDEGCSPRPTSSSPTTVTPVPRGGPASLRSASPTPTTRRCSSARQRATSRSACPSTTT